MKLTLNKLSTDEWQVDLITPDGRDFHARAKSIGMALMRLGRFVEHMPLDLLFTTYAEAQSHQLREWVAGRPWHNPWSPNADAPDYTNKASGECCPDFSCCRPGLLWPRKKREAFANAEGHARFEMLWEALTGLTAGEGVYIAGGNVE